ncbi:translation initiation factor IF-2-like isoform X2 [Octopus bimaculoides]|uniref:translation initiation factor IF-2-like isoform X2 n=1 Tax=Octopus bimaculoides TaxID=37653 RepID=UPI0022E64C90|nr:translation initiation factor IF-2-like isoform X2 [Octopus bimaculoides]
MAPNMSLLVSILSIIAIVQAKPVDVAPSALTKNAAAVPVEAPASDLADVAPAALAKNAAAVPVEAPASDLADVAPAALTKNAAAVPVEAPASNPTKRL